MNRNGPRQEVKKDNGPVWGTGVKLGDTTSTPVSESTSPHGESVIRQITFYANGFLIHDGTFHLYSDPQTQLYMAQFKSGFEYIINNSLIFIKRSAPMQLLGVRYNQKCELSIAHKMEEEYSIPKVVEKFAGEGYSLSGPSTTPSSASIVPVAQEERPAVIVNQALPVTTIQIRLLDGNRIVSQFNTTHLIADVAQFVRSSRSGGGVVALVSGFPPKLLDLTMSLEDAGVLGSVISEKRL